MKAPTSMHPATPASMATAVTPRVALALSPAVSARSVSAVMMPVKLAVLTIARLMPPLSIEIIMPIDRNARIGSWDSIDCRFDSVGNRSGLSAVIRTTIATRIT